MNTSDIETLSICPRRVVRAVSVTTALAFLAFGAVEAAAQDVSYKGKRINAIIGYSPGGGTDAAARLLGRYMKNYMPGKPTMIFRNMPGHRGTVAADYVANSQGRHLLVRRR
jgi:tripartite-type tricarboxylate transporter receptor subunit TctC